MKRSLAMSKPFGVPSVPKASITMAPSLTSPRAVFGSMAEATVAPEPAAKKARSQVADSAAAECSDANTASLGTPPAAVAPAEDDSSAGAPPAPREAAKSLTFAEVLESFAPEAQQATEAAELPATVASPELRVASPEPAAAIDYSFFLQALEAAEQAAQTLLENERGRAEAAAEAARGHEARAAELLRALDAARADATAASEAARQEAERVAGEHAAALAEARAQAERAQADAAALRAAIAGANSATLALQQAVAAAAAAVGEAAQLAAA